MPVGALVGTPPLPEGAIEAQGKECENDQCGQVLKRISVHEED
jgi:hypothetical protein